MTAEFIETLNNHDYHAMPRLSSSDVRRLLRSPAHYQAGLIATEDTEAMRFGRALHASILEPETFTDHFAVAPKCDKRTKEGKATWSEFQDTHQGKEIISVDDILTISIMRESIRLHPVASHAFTGGSAELTALWDCNGHPCQARFDYLKRSRGVAFDLKSTCDASPEGFSKSIATFGYHIQAAWYAMGFKAVTGEDLADFVFIAIEKTAPYAVAAYRLDDEAMQIGKHQCLRALKILETCKADDHWPGYGDNLQGITLPRWAMMQP
ncbi:Exodeoxyribonuclease VIII [Gammaproteobacteria bacterium]